MQYFRHNKFSSFRRQLNLYGYRKVIKGPDAGAYMHPSFQRGRPDLLPEVKKGKVSLTFWKLGSFQANACRTKIIELSSSEAGTFEAVSPVTPLTLLPGMRAKKH